MSNDIPKFNLLAVFAAVIEQGSLSKAAEHLNTNQSTISTSLNRLKTEIGHELFIRSGRGVVPTAFASSLYIQIKSPIEQLSDVLNGLNEFDPKKSKRQFKITAPEHLQLMLLNHFESIANKAISIEVFDQPYDDQTMYDGILTQKFDMMIDIFPPSHTNIESVRLFDGEFVIVCRKEHPRIKEALNETQYMNEKHAILERTRSQMYSLGHYTNIDISKRKVAYHGVSLFSNLLVCSQSDYLTTVPLSMALQFNEQLQLQIFEPPFKYKKMSNYLIWLKKNNKDPEHLWFKNELVQVTNTLLTK